MSSWLNGLMGKAVAPTQKQSVSTLLERVENVSTAEERRKAIADLRLLVDNPIHVKVRSFSVLRLSRPIPSGRGAA